MIERGHALSEAELVALREVAQQERLDLLAVGHALGEAELAALREAAQQEQLEMIAMGHALSEVELTGLREAAQREQLEMIERGHALSEAELVALREVAQPERLDLLAVEHALRGVEIATQGAASRQTQLQQTVDRPQNETLELNAEQALLNAISGRTTRVASSDMCRACICKNAGGSEGQSTLGSISTATMAPAGSRVHLKASLHAMASAAPGSEGEDDSLQSRVQRWHLFSQTVNVLIAWHMRAARRAYVGEAAADDDVTRVAWSPHGHSWTCVKSKRTPDKKKKKRKK